MLAVDVVAGLGEGVLLAMLPWATVPVWAARSGRCVCGLRRRGTTDEGSAVTAADMCAVIEDMLIRVNHDNENVGVVRIPVDSSLNGDALLQRAPHSAMTCGGRGPGWLRRCSLPLYPC